MQIGYIGLGKMGSNMVKRLLKKKHKIVAFDRSAQAVNAVSKLGAVGSSSISEMLDKIKSPKTVWIMVPQAVVDDVLDELLPLLKRGDTVIDGGNSFFKDSVRRSKKAKAKGVGWLDAGISGGPSGALNGSSVMVGGDKKVFKKYEKLFKDLAVKNGYGYMGEAGAGHFVKMVHNGIEYGMMQSIAEGFAIMKKSKYKLDLQGVAKVYNHSSVIESRLVGWLMDGYKKFGQDLKGVSGAVGHTGEGKWTAKIAKELNIPAPIIEGAFKFRVQSAKKPSYTGRILSTLRNMFGGHAFKK